MVKARTWLALALISLGTIAATVSCGSDETTGGGSGGGLISGGSGGSGGAVNRGGSGGTGPISALGASCTSDAECGTGLICLPPSDPDVGPANGLCTAACTTNGDCDALSTGAGCVQFASNSYCLEGCAQGDPGPDLSVKCHGRLDEACAEYQGSVSSVFLCAPLCAQDSDCGSGLFCDHSQGLGQCIPTKPTGDPAGTPCDPTATTNNCDGFCLQTSATGVTPVTAYCAEPCSVSAGCNFDGTKPLGACLGAISNPSGALDLGYCEEACGCDADCIIPGDLCQTWPPSLSSFKSGLGTAGLCLPLIVPGDTELSCTGEGGAGAGGASGNPGGENAGAAGN
ncbi:MAG TPA: hypothetical protein VGM44_20950 [Polyangiaceae bacterium]